MSCGPDTCLICESPSRGIVFDFDRPDQYEEAMGITGEGYVRQWVACRDCGFHYSRYSRDPEKFEGIYETTYRDPSSTWRQENAQEMFLRMTAKNFADSETKQRVQWIKHSLDRLADMGEKGLNGFPAHFLDVGGANGIFAHDFRDFRWQPHVVDPSDAGRFLPESYEIAYTQSRFSEASFDRKFDLISMIYVLEHLRDPDRALASARGNIAAAGMVFVEVPAAKSFRIKTSEDDIFNSCHLWMFRHQDLSRLLIRNGFREVARRETTTVRGNEALMMLAVVQ